MKQRVSLTVVQKQIGKCNEIAILQKIKIHLQIDILEQGWSSVTFMLKVSLSIQKLFSEKVCFYTKMRVFLHKNKSKRIFREGLP